ncbi:hypothetical protein FACS189459_5440 [Bacilli bacterium]|nr:hypothetical protein FACS189459_5440 [Bacilli bacterium]
MFLYNNTIDKLDDKQKQVVINKIENEIDEISCMKNEYEIVNNTAK